MKRLSKWLLVGLLPLLLLVPAATGKPPPTRSVPTNGEVMGLAFDGARVVYGIRPYGVTYQSMHSGTSSPAAHRPSTDAEEGRGSPSPAPDRLDRPGRKPE